MSNFSNNLTYVDTPSLIYVGIAVSLAMLELPAITIALVTLWRDRKHAVEPPQVEGVESTRKAA